MTQEEILDRQNLSNQNLIDLSIGKLEYIDGDTVRDPYTGAIFRMKGYDSLETLDSEKATYTGKTELKTTPLKELVESGALTTDDLYSNLSGVDKYGRMLVDIPKLTEASILSGTAVPSNKYDQKNQELYRKYIEKNKDILGEDRLEELDKLREYDLDKTEYNLGIWGRIKNDLKTIGASATRLGSTVGDFVLDSTYKALDSLFNTELGDSLYFNKKKTSEYNYDKWGVFTYNKDFDMKEAVHNFKLGNYGQAIIDATVHADELFADSSADMVMLFSGIGEMNALSKAKGIIDGIKTLVKGNAGLLLHAASMANNDLEERAKNNKNGKVDFVDGLNAFATEIVVDLLDRASFGTFIKGEKIKLDALKSIIDGIGGKERIKIAKTISKNILNIGSKITKGGLYEGGSEALQEYLQILTTTVGTDKYGNVLPTGEEQIDRVIEAGLSGAGMGIGISGGIHNIETIAKKMAEIKQEPYKQENSEPINKKEDTAQKQTPENIPEEQSQEDSIKQINELTKEPKQKELNDILEEYQEKEQDIHEAISGNTKDSTDLYETLKSKLSEETYQEYQDIYKKINEAKNKEKEKENIVDNTEYDKKQIESIYTITSYMNALKNRTEQIIEDTNIEEENKSSQQKNINQQENIDIKEQDVTQEESATQKENTTIEEKDIVQEADNVAQEEKEKVKIFKERVKNGIGELNKSLELKDEILQESEQIKTPEERTNFIKKGDNFADKIVQHFTRKQYNRAFEIRNEIIKKLQEDPANGQRLGSGDTLGIGSKEGLNVQDLQDIYQIVDAVESVKTATYMHKQILEKNPITKKSLGADENNSSSISKEVSKLTVDEINELLDIASDEDSKRIFEEALQDKAILEENKDIDNSFFYGDESNIGFFDIDRNNKEALKKYKQNKINEYNEASKALNKSRANNNKPVSILNNTRTIRANNSLDNKYVSDLKKEVDFLKSYNPEPTITKEEVVQKISEDKEKKQQLQERQSVGSIISDIDKSGNREEAKKALINGFKKLKQEGVLDKYKGDLQKAYKLKLDAINEPIAKVEPKKEETEENKARRLEQKINELDNQLKNVFKVDSKEKADKAQKKNYEKKEELRKKLKILYKKQKELHIKRKKLENEIREARKKKKEKIAKAKEEKLSILETVINKIRNTTASVIEKIKVLLNNVSEEQKRVKSLIEEIQKEIEPISKKQYKAKDIAKKKEILLKEYKKRLQKTEKLTDKAVNQIKHIDNGFYKTIKELNLPKGIRLNSIDAIEKIQKLNRNIDGYNGSDFSSKEKEIEYFNEIVKPLVIQIRDLISRVSDRGEIFKRVFNTEDAFKYNELLKGIDKNLLTNLVTAVTIDSMMNYGGLMAQINTDEEIADFLGLTSEHEVTSAMRQKFGYGKLRTTIVSNMQNMINEYIYLKSEEPMAKEKFGTAIALLATHVMKESSITNIEEVKIPVSELNKYRATPYNSNEAKTVNILRAKETTFLNREKSIRGKGKSIINKVFSIKEKRERTEPLPKHKDEAINKLQNTPRQIKQEIIDLYKELGEDKFREFFRNILGYDERVSENYKSHKVHVSKEASIKGKNLQIDDSIDGLISVIEQVGNKPIYFRYEKKSEHRLHLMAELINPQSNKLHRFATHAVNSTREISKEDKNKMLIWKSAILDGLGIKWKSGDDIELEFEALFEDSNLLAYLTNNTTLPTSSLVQKYGEEAHSLTALIELKKYYNTKEKSFKTSLEKETDAQNSGSTLQSIFYFNPLDVESIKMLHKGGIFTNSTETKRSNEYDGLDNYEESSMNFHNNIIDENNKYEHNRLPEPPKLKQGEKASIGANNAYVAKVTRYNLYNRFFLPLLGSWAKVERLTPEYLAKGRKFFKRPIIAKGYTAGDKSIQVEKFDETIESFYDILEEIVSEPTKQNIQEVLKLINALQYYNQDIDGNLLNLKDNKGNDIAPMFWGEEHKNIHDLINNLKELDTLQNIKNPDLKIKRKILKTKDNISYFEFTDKQLSMLLSNYRKTMGKVVTDSMNKVLEPLSFGTKLIQKITNMHNKLFLHHFFDELDKVSKKQGYITKEDMANITNHLVQKGIAPIIRAYDGSVSELMKRGFNEQINDIIDQKQYEVKIGTAHKNDNRLELSTQTIGVSSWIDIGVRTPALTTLMTDASVMSNIIKSSDIKNMGLYIFDAILSSEGGAKKYNSEINNLINSGYSPILATIQSAKKAFRNFEWNKENINKILNSSISDRGETKPYRQWAIARLMMFHDEIGKKINNKEQIDAYMISAVSSTIISERNEIRFDGIPIDFFTELYNLNRENLKHSVTSIDHSIGIDDNIEISKNRKYRLNIEQYKTLYNKYKKIAYSELSTNESLEKLRSDIDNYVSIDDLNNISLYENIGKKNAKIQEVISQFKIVISEIEKLGNKIKNMSDKEMIAHLKDNNIDISAINQNLLRKHLVDIREAKKEPKKSLDTEEQFIPKQKISLTQDNLMKVYETIDSLSPDRLDTEFESKLKSLLKTLILPTIETIALSIGKTDNMSFGEAVGSHIANIAVSTKKGKGLFISAQEVYAHELVHNITEKALKNMNVFTYQVLDIMKDIKQKYKSNTYKLFLNQEVKHTKADIKLAKQMANHVFGSSGNLSEFIAYALTNRNFMNNLSGISSTKIHLDKSSWLSRVLSIFQIAIDKLKQLLTTGKLDNNMQSKIDTLVKNSVGISITNNNQAISSFLSGINAMMGFYNNNIAPSIDKINNKYTEYVLVKRAKLIKNNFEIIGRISNSIKKPTNEIIRELIQGNIKTISLVLLTMGMQKIPYNKDFGIKTLIMMMQYKDAISKYIKSKKNILTDELVTLYENVTKTAKDTSQVVSAIRRSIKAIDVEREMLRTNTHNMIKEKLDNMQLDEGEKFKINTMFVKNKIYRLSEFFSTDEIINLITTPTKFANIYKKQINKKALPHVERLIIFRENQLRTAMFRNPFIIASRFDYRSLKAIHAYSTLKSISSVDSKLITKLKNNKKEFHELMSIANEVEKESVDKLHKGNFDRLSDNEFIQNSNKVNFVRYILSTDKKSLKEIKELDGKLIKQIRNPFSSNSSIFIYEVKPLRESYTRGAIVYGNKTVNKTLDALYYELYNKEMPKKFKNRLISNDYVYSMNDSRYKVFDPLSLDERKQFLNHKDTMENVYANTLARSYEKEKSNKINREVIDLIVRLSLEGKDTMKSQLDKTDNNEWLELSDPNSKFNHNRLDNKFKEIDKLWYLLPRDTQEYIESKYNGKVYIKADGNTKNILLGSRDASIANLFKKLPRGRRVIKTMENWWKALMDIWKSTVIIKMPHTLAQNAISNIFLTMAKGYNFYEVVKYQKEGMLALEDYMRTNELLHQEQLKKKMNLPHDDRLIVELKARLENNKIKPLADEGLLATRIEDLTLTDTFEKIEPIQKIVNELPEEVVKLGSQLYLTKDTNYFKAMYRLTQASDFVARYAQIELEKRYSKKPYTQIFNEALDDFIQYDIPTGKLIRWLDQVTFLPFVKYYLHIQKVIARLIASNPKAVLGLEAFDMAITNLATPFDDSILTISPLDKIRDPLGNLEDIVIPEPVRWLSGNF